MAYYEELQELMLKFNRGEITEEDFVKMKADIMSRANPIPDVITSSSNMNTRKTDKPIFIIVFLAVLALAGGTWAYFHFTSPTYGVQQFMDSKTGKNASSITINDINDVANAELAKILKSQQVLSSMTDAVEKSTYVIDKITTKNDSGTANVTLTLPMLKLDSSLGRYDIYLKYFEKETKGIIQLSADIDKSIERSTLTGYTIELKLPLYKCGILWCVDDLYIEYSQALISIDRLYPIEELVSEIEGKTDNYNFDFYTPENIEAVYQNYLIFNKDDSHYKDTAYKLNNDELAAGVFLDSVVDDAIELYPCAADVVSYDYTTTEYLEYWIAIADNVYDIQLDVTEAYDIFLVKECY